MKQIKDQKYNSLDYCLFIDDNTRQTCSIIRQYGDYSKLFSFIWEE